MATHEHTINDALAAVLRGTRHSWQAPDVIRSETTGTLKGTSRRPDILVLEDNVSPVAIETELIPASTVEADALSRLGAKLRDTTHTILSVVAVRLPGALSRLSGNDLSDALSQTADLGMALYTGSGPESYRRLPVSGWIHGSAADLSILVQHASVPPDVIDQAARVLEDGIKSAAGLLGEMKGSHAGALKQVCKELKQEDSEQTRRMIAAILANAFVFHHSLARGPGQLEEVRTLEEMRGAKAGLSQAAVLVEWRRILAVNYWPIFDIARRILQLLPTAVARDVITALAATADQLVENRLMRSHDLTGAVFQRLIADRKFLAAYYTTPAAAALLAGLAISPGALPGGRPWSSQPDVERLRIGDLACGTGTLLSSAYQRVGQLYELAGGDAEAIHPSMMASGLVGCDVLPAAAHLTASMLAGTHPTKKYTQSSVLTVAYGKQSGGRIALGSLDLLDPHGRLDGDDITARPAAGNSRSARKKKLEVPHASFDLVIMNPPFTRATGHEGSQVRTVHNPMFAAFGFTREVQEAMSAAAERATRNTSAHGNAGEASIFLVLANRKLKVNGVLALVMPLSLLAGDAWEGSRAALAREYSDLVIVSIAAAKTSEATFSADTDMGECLVVGRKAEKPWLTQKPRGVFVTLDRRPEYPLVGAQIAREIRRVVEGGNIQKLEDGPNGGTPIKFGADTVGRALDAPLPASGWLLSRISDVSLAQTAYQIATHGRFWLPSMTEDQAPFLTVGTVEGIGAQVGPHHRDIQAGPEKKVRGPFRIEQVAADAVPTYPALWGHAAERERTMAFDADCEAIPLTRANAADRATVAAKVADVFATASHCHLNRDFRFNSQSTALQYTERESIGGRAWPSIKLGSAAQEKALVLWGNTTFGLLLYWWHANKQQSGRGSVPITPARSLPVLDVTKLSAQQMARAVAIFEEMRGRELRPMNEIDTDAVRHELDSKFANEVLGLSAALLRPNGPLDVLRKKLAREPSVHGGKRPRSHARPTPDAVGADEDD